MIQPKLKLIQPKLKYHVSILGIFRNQLGYISKEKKVVVECFTPYKQIGYAGQYKPPCPNCFILYLIFFTFTY